MSPIRESEKLRYPPDWPMISKRIKERAEWRCECAGECGGTKHRMYLRLVGRDPEVDGPRCPNRHGEPSLFGRGRVVLTTAHLDHVPENCAPDNLRAMCQSCHLNYDREHHVETRRLSQLEPSHD